MHTSNALSFLFWGAVFVAMAAQIVSYCSNRRTPGRTVALVLGLLAAILSGAAGWQADTDWGALPKSPEGLRSGQLWNDGGIPAIAQ
jgi:hypothetical protein